MINGQYSFKFLKIEELTGKRYPIDYIRSYEIIIFASLLLALLISLLGNILFFVLILFPTSSIKPTSQKDYTS